MNTATPWEYTRTYEDIFHMYLVNTDVHRMGLHTNTPADTLKTAQVGTHSLTHPTECTPQSCAGPACTSLHMGKSFTVTGGLPSLLCCLCQWKRQDGCVRMLSSCCPVKTSCKSDAACRLTVRHGWHCHYHHTPARDREGSRCFLTWLWKVQLLL